MEVKIMEDGKKIGFFISLDKEEIEKIKDLSKELEITEEKFCKVSILKKIKEEEFMIHNNKNE